MERKIEILAPAGSYESMRATMNAGCDAVYMGGSRFGARAYADNPDEDNLVKAIEEAHLRNKRIYLTVNTLIKEDERVNLLYDYLYKYYLAGLDAVIVQDVGVMHFIHRHFPSLPIHASTQTTLMMAEGASLLKDVGVTRLVTARELSFKEIKNIRDNTDMEIETFVHGALCYCYSGQCLMSSMIGGRSGNRGRCAQPCRMPYQFFSEGRKISADREAYLLSPKDINTVALIPQLIEAGVDSFKIEGRMKRPEYAAGVTYVYRKYVDLYLSGGKEAFYEYLKEDDYKKDMLHLMDLYNRGGFSEGYGNTYNGKKMMSMVRPNHSGVQVGEVTEVKKGYADILLSEDVNAQDILEIRSRENEPVYEFTVKDSLSEGEVLRARIGTIPVKNKVKDSRNRPDKAEISTGALVCRTRNNALLEDIGDKYIKKDVKQGIKGHLRAKQGESLQLTLRCREQSVTAHHNIVEAAIKQPMAEDKLRASIDKLGDTFFKFEDLSIDADNNIFVPVAWLNEIRREAVEMLSEAIIKAYDRTGEDMPVPQAHRSCRDMNDNRYDDANNDIHNDTINISVGVQTEDQFLTVLSYPEISSIYVEYNSFSLQKMIVLSGAASAAGKETFILLPHICRPAVYEKLNKDIFTLTEDNAVSGFIARNFEEVQLLKSIFKDTGRHKKIRLDHTMYVFNKESICFWREKGIQQFTAPVELNHRELKELGLQDGELMVYGYLPVMVSAQCLHASTKSCNKCAAGETRTDYIVDRIGKKFYIKTNCSSCYNIIYNGQRLSLLGQSDRIMDLKPDKIRLDFTCETPQEMEAVLSAYRDVFVDGQKAVLEFDNITTGHFKRGVE